MQAQYKQNMKLLLLTVVLFSFSYCFQQETAQETKNVLFIAIDDLRPDLGAYGQQQIKSPHIDALASKSILFERAYCQVAVCSPSRTSLLTGRRPDTNHVWKIAPDEYWRKVPNATNATTIPQYFKENGYLTIGMGKIFHPGAPNGNDDTKYSWSPEGLPYFHADQNESQAKDNSWYVFDVADNELQDGKLADNAIKVLKGIKQNRTSGDDKRPFFVAIGFHRPHLAWYCPKKYYDMYPPIEEIKLAENPDPPKDMPPIAYSSWRGERFKDLKEQFANVSNCDDSHTDIIYDKKCAYTDTKAKEMRRAYYSCISYTDAQLGRVVEELENQGFADDTIVVLWADHGWQLGEHNIWSKFTNFEDGTHVPFMIHVPGMTDKGMTTKALVELIDIFPSITELAGIEKPPLCSEVKNEKSTACVEGSSIAPLLKDPNQEWKKGAFSQFPRPYSGLSVIPGHPPFKNDHMENVMGYTIRTDKYRFTEWYSFDRMKSEPNFNEIWGTELYDHTTPTQSFNDENTNLAAKDEMKSVVDELRKMLHAGWSNALPPSDEQ